MVQAHGDSGLADKIHPMRQLYAFPRRRFARALASMHAWLGADADHYSFIAVDLHHLLLAGFPAHIHPYELRFLYVLP